MYRFALLLMFVGLTVACSDSSDSPGSDSLGRVAAIDRNYATVTEQVAELPDHNIYRPLDIEHIDQPAPVIVWGNGGCVRFDGVWRTLLEGWARAGFVVITHTIPSNGDDPRINPTTVGDLALMIDWAFAENARINSPYRGQLDLQRVVAAGNSCGGIIATGLASIDSRVKAVFVLSGSSGFSEETSAAVMGNILVPVGYAVGGDEDIASRFALFDYDALPTSVPAMLAKRFEGDHNTVSTSESILSSEIVEISVNWIDFALYRDANVGQALSQNPCVGCAPGTWEIQAKNFDLHAADSLRQ